MYECLSGQFIEPQLALSAAERKTSVVSLIEMGNEATAIFQRLPIDDALFAFLQKRKNLYAKNHGNYLPALEQLHQVMLEDVIRDVQLMVVFLSDGSPSDHTNMACKHGVYVWQEDGSRPSHGRGQGRKAFFECSQAVACRRAVCESVHTQCLDAVRQLGDWFGRDRLRLFTVAFGAPSEDYRVLETMANVLPRSSFQKLGLTATSLQSAMTTLSSTLTSLRTETDPTRSRATRALCSQEKADLDYLSSTDLYSLSYDIIAKWEFDTALCNWVHVQSVHELSPHTRHGIAVVKQYFSKGAERAAFVSTEVLLGEIGVCQRIGPRLVAKESLFEDQHKKSLTTYSSAAIIQADASTYARLFNEAAMKHPKYSSSWNIRFVKCAMYEVFDHVSPLTPATVSTLSTLSTLSTPHPVGEGRPRKWILSEPELEGVYTKWNNNGGKINLSEVRSTSARPRLGAIYEEDEDEEEEEEEEDLVTENDVIQAFSHFTLALTAGQRLVVDLQGVYNPTDGFTLTDPAIHSVAETDDQEHREHRNGRTDRGELGINLFLESHVCSNLCRWMQREFVVGAGVVV